MKEEKSTQKELTSFIMNLKDISLCRIFKKFEIIFMLKKSILTEVAGEVGPDLEPQKFLLAPEFRFLGE